MKMDCEEIKGLLGAWLDGELGQADGERVRTHVEGCALCSADRRRLERLQGCLRNALVARASGLAFEPFWKEVEQRILERRPWGARAWDWLRPVFYPQRLAWAIPLAIVLLLGFFSLEQFSPGWRWGANRGNAAAVDSIDGHGFNVAVFRESKTKTTVIWLFENQEDEDEASTEPASADTSF